MARPTIFFQKTQTGSLPPGDVSNRNTDRWTEEAEFGTVLRGDGATTGIFMGSLTNGSVSDDYEVVISHDALNEVTNCMFYMQPTTNNRTGADGLTHTADEAGALEDFEELKVWGQGQKDLDDSLSSGEEGGAFLYPTFAVPALGTESEWVLRTGNMDDVPTSKPLTDSFYYDGINSVGAIGGSIQPFVDYVSSDAAFVTTKLKIPESLEDAGARQFAYVIRLTYTF